MASRKAALLMVCAFATASCSFGPRLHSALPQVRDAPVLANVSPSESLVRGRSYLGARQYGLAIELFKMASREPSLKAESLNGLAVAYDGIGRRDLAERYFQEALAADPDDPRTRRNLARLYARTGNAAKGRKLLAETAPVAPGAVEAAASEKGDMSAPARETASTLQIFDSGSPLGSSLPPLLVRAGLPPLSAPLGGVADVPPDEASILCMGIDAKSSLAHSEGAMRIFRLTIGEVFIGRQPLDTDCRVADPVSAPTPMSNKEYLGLVAAYLDELNRNPRAVQIATLWQAAFRLD